MTDKIWLWLHFLRLQEDFLTSKKNVFSLKQGSTQTDCGIHIEKACINSLHMHAHEIEFNISIQ